MEPTIERDFIELKNPVCKLISLQYGSITGYAIKKEDNIKVELSVKYCIPISDAIKFMTILMDVRSSYATLITSKYNITEITQKEISIYMGRSPITIIADEKIIIIPIASQKTNINFNISTSFETSLMNFGENIKHYIGSITVPKSS
jgi:hypothetical protein